MLVSTLSICCALIFCQCLDQSEGCLDALASNFEVAASENCCCEYPNLQLGISHRYGNETFSLRETYTNDLGQNFQILDLSYFISEVSVRQGDNWYSVDDSLTVQSLAGSSENFHDDIVMVQRTQFEYPVGSFRRSGSFEGIRFSVGLAAPRAALDRSSLPDDHLLNNLGSSLYDADQGRHRDLYVQVVLEPADTFSIVLPGGSEVGMITLTGNASKERGFDLDYALDVDYRSWFTTLDLSDKDNVGMLLEECISKAFTITE